MSFTRVIAAMCMTISLAGCDPMAANAPSDAFSHGRYSGVGVFSAGKMWAHLKTGDVSRDLDSATVKDDESIIVIMDGKTGEVRECGNFSGFCTSIQPWTRVVSSTPTKLDAHASDISDQNTPAPAAVDNAAADNAVKP